MEENPIQIEIEDNTTFTGGSAENLQRLFDASPEFKQILIKSNLKDLSKYSKIIIYPPCAADFGGENPEKDDRFIIKCIKDKDKSGYKSGNLVGFIGYGKERLTIKSRFGNTLFLYLLEKVLQIQIAKNFKADANSLDNLDILCLLFPFYLKSAMTRGLYKEYIERLYNDSNLRGKLDISRFIKEDIPFTGKVPYFCREFTFDNGITELICCTIDYIERHKRLSALLSGVQEEVRKIKTAAFSYKSQNKEKIIEWDKRHSIKNGFYSTYRPLQTLCLDILQNHKSSLGTGPDQIYGVLFDCAWLWEEYINTLIGEEHGYNFQHPRNTNNTGGEYFYEKLRGGKHGEARRMYPDFVNQKVSPAIIVDAKYRPIAEEESIRKEDLDAMLCYCLYYGANKGYFVYPCREIPDTEEQYYSQALLCKDLCFTTCGILIPETKDYGDFAKKMQNNEDKFKSDFVF